MPQVKDMRCPKCKQGQMKRELKEDGISAKCWSCKEERVFTPINLWYRCEECKLIVEKDYVKKLETAIWTAFKCPECSYILRVKHVD